MATVADTGLMLNPEGIAVPKPNVPIGCLRAFVTLLVVAHHAFLAYHAYAPPQSRSLTGDQWWMAFPIVDSRRWPGIEAFIGFNDVFFMSLMFLISGIFVSSSLARKGAAGFFRDRALRLGIPFVISATLLAPLAYYPAFLAGDRVGSFWQQWLALGIWPAGPAWFLWVLLAFSGLAAVTHRFYPSWSQALAGLTGRLSTSPAAYFMVLIATSAIAYLPMAAAFTPEHWFSAGPFFAQSSRVLHYLVYFFAGAGLGAYGVNRGLLASDGKLARRWYVWAGVALVAFALCSAAFIVIISTLQSGGPGLALKTISNGTFVLSCAASSIAFLAIFLRFVRRPNRVWDSLSRNAYGIYLLHYVCVTWLQLSLLGADLPGAIKGILVFTGAVALSWLLSNSQKSQQL